MGRAEKIPATPSKAKRRILTAAAKLFRERGFARCTVRDLADDVGILSGSLFHHFKSKDEILFSVMERVIIEMDEALNAALAEATTTKDRVRALVHNQLEFIHGTHGDATAVLLYEWNALSPEGQAGLLNRRKRYFARRQEVLDEASQQNLIAIEPALLRQLMHGAIVWSARWFNPDGTLTIAELEKAVLTLVLR